MSVVTLPPMPWEEWDAWRTASIHRYAADMVRSGSWEAGNAEARARTLFARLVPDGPATAGHQFRSIVNEVGDRVGAVWFAADEEFGRTAAFVWDIVVDPPYRGRGYGRAAMEALEPLARDLGYDAIRLHVFGDNEVARHLYTSVGYAETDVSMVKRLA
jgi:ribosomal protein S18 acetylase RimI-like enzyme